MAHSSSQQGQVGPKPWNDHELRVAGALGCNRIIRVTDLDNPVHNIFQRHRWLGISDDDYSLLEPSMRLASLFLETGMPYLTNFLPSEQIHNRFRLEKMPHEMEAYNRFALAYHIPIKPIDDVTEQELQAARDELDDIAEYVTWRVDGTMLVNKSWLGITRLVSDAYAPPPYRDLQAVQIDEADEDARDANQSRRPLLVVIMSEYVDALRRYNSNSEPFIRAQFLAAYTMAHEIGHVVWAQDFRSRDYSRVGIEPWVADDPISELGSSFMSWIFSGYDPNVKLIENRMFESQLIWTYRPKPGGRKPGQIYRTLWSLSISYMEDALDRSVWTSILSNESSKEWSKESRDRFKPDISQAAVASEAEWNALGGYPRWPTRIYAERQAPSKLPNVTPEDLEYMRKFHITEDGDGEFGEECDSFDPARNAFSEIGDLDVSTLPERPIHDGICKSTWASYNDKSWVIRVEVRFRAAEEPALAKASSLSSSSLKRRHVRAAAAAADDGNHGKRRRTVSYDPENSDEVTARNIDKSIRFSDKEDYDCRDIDQVLKHISVKAVEGISMLQALSYCIKHDLLDLEKIPRNAAEQDRRLDVERDSALIGKIRAFRLLNAEESFKDIPEALLKIKIEQRNNIDLLAPADVTSILEGYGDDRTFLNERQKLRILKSRYDVQIRDLPQALVDRYRPNNEDKSWTPQEATKFLESRGLPTWGDFRAQKARLERLEAELNNPQGVSRKGINIDSNGLVKRTDPNGVEVYVWDVDIGNTTVGTLKGELYVKGLFPANCTLDLHFGNNRQKLLEDKYLLYQYDSSYMGTKTPARNWKDLWVTVKMPDPRSDPAPLVEKLVYQPRNSRLSSSVLHPNDEDNDDDGEDSNDGKSHGSAESDVEEVPEYMKRLRETVINNGAKTFNELLESINSGKANMDRAFLPGGGHDSMLKPNGTRAKPLSIADIQNNLDDLVEAEKERAAIIDFETMDPKKRREMIEAARADAMAIALSTPRPLTRGDDGGGMTPAALGESSHMRSLYNMLPTPVRERKGAPPLPPPTPSTL